MLPHYGKAGLVLSPAKPETIQAFLKNPKHFSEVTLLLGDLFLRSLVFSLLLCVSQTLAFLISPCTCRTEAQTHSLHGIMQQTTATCFGCMGALKSEMETPNVSQAAYVIVPAYTGMIHFHTVLFRAE